MSNINDLYKESGIQPGGFDRDPKKDRQKSSGTKGNYYLISIVVSAVIFGAIFFFLQSDTARHSDINFRNYTIFIVGLVYVINFLIRFFIRKFSSKD